jgi:hypothetical protein
MKMSSFKKMYLVGSDKKLNEEERTVNPYHHVISPYLQSVSKLDEYMKDILNSDMNDDEKAKLYTNVLKKYLIHRHKFMEPNFETKDYVDFKPAERTPKKLANQRRENFIKVERRKKLNFRKDL